MDERVFGLMEAAEWHQKAAEKATQAFEAKTGELAQTLMLSRQAMLDALKAGAAEGTKAALSEATKPVTANLAKATDAAKEASGELSEAAAGIRLKWARTVTFSAFGAMAAVIVVAWVMSWFQRQEVERLSAERARLEGEVWTLQVNVAELEKRGGRLVFSTCGVRKRLCIQVEEKQTDDLSAPYRGPYGSEGKKETYVIPKGY